jgi:predicted ATPase/class 3 adenylate cyclase
MPEHELHQPPTGTVTFLYTDIEGSTRRWEQHPAEMKAAVERHDAILRRTIEAHGGVVFRTMGDAFCASFPIAPDALVSAIDAQRVLHDEPWSEVTGPIKVRMALHTGIGEVRDGDYVGPPLNRVARLVSAGHGGQVLVSRTTYDLVSDTLPPGATLRDMGEHRLKDLQHPEQIFELALPDLPADFPPLKTLDIRPNNLPVQRSPLVGREAELATVQRLLLRNDTGLLTLTGAGGIGKTRMALQVAAELIDKFQDGVFFVSLAHITDPTLVAPAIAQALNIKEDAGRSLTADLADYLSDKQLLLVLDNFEQVLKAVSVASALLAAAPRLKVLATSREVLHLKGEQEFNVPPLRMPDLTRLPAAQALSQYDAVALFIQLARLVRPDFQVTNETAPAIAEICYRLDGLPLAIELAAARIRLLTPQAMLARLASRLRLLTGGARDLPERQQTLRSTLQWSYDLLQPAEQQLFRRMTVFVGGCTLEAAEAVCGPGAGNSSSPQPPAPSPLSDVLDLVASLVDKSLVRQEVDADGEPRFVMMETIREYGTELLESTGSDEAELLRRAYAEYYLAIARASMAGILTGTGDNSGRSQSMWLHQLTVEHDNLTAALDWAIARRDAGMALDFAGDLWWFWRTAGYHSEGVTKLREVLPLAGDVADSAPTASRANVLLGISSLAWTAGDFATAASYAEQSAAIFRELGEEWTWAYGYALVNVGASLGFAGNREAARAAVDEGIAALRSAGNKWALATGLFDQGMTASATGEYAEARTYLEEGRALSREVGNLFTLSQLSNTLGDVLRILGEYAQARGPYEEALSLYRQLNLWNDIPATTHNLGYVALAEHDIQRARELFVEALNSQIAYKNALGISECLAGLAGVAGAEERPERAARLFGAADALREASGHTMWPAEKVDYDRNLAVARAQLDQPSWDAAYSAGRALTMEQAIEYALADS